MKRLPPPEIDALMWSVAESGDVAAIDQFGERYPEFRTELAKRMQMVRELKNSRPEGPAFAPPPRFKAPVPQRTMWNSRLAWIVAPLALAGVAFGSYAITVSRLTPPPAPIPKGPDPIVKLDPSGYPDSTPLESSDPTPTGTSERVPPVVNNSTPTGPAPYDMPVGLKFEKVSLHTAIDAIGKTSGLKIELAPGLEDFDISMRYSGMTAIAILRDMGRNFGFTVFEQEPGRVLLIPEVDPNQQENLKTVPPATPGSNGTTINPNAPGKTETSSGDANAKSGG